MNEEYLKTQIITYMGNKRKLLPIIEENIEKIKMKINKQDLITGDAFSGSGIVSRLLKTKSKELYSNDIAGYSCTLNNCYLSSPSQQTTKKINEYIEKANDFANKNTPLEPWISKHWSPKNNKINKDDRVYFSHENGKRIDLIRDYILSIPKKYQPYLLAPLLVESSIHNNTNGQFSAFYKNIDGIGKYGGKNEVDINRITKPINLPIPIFYNNDCKISVSQMDALEWAKDIRKKKKLDIVYLDPPYNKHPYNIYYFLLDIINDWDKQLEIPNTNRGQPLNWITSPYNSSKNAKNAMIKLLENLNANYVMLSYNDGGIIPISELDELLKKFSNDIEKIPINHKTYNRLKGISNYKREKDYKPVKEYLYIIKF
jgi:adenine-specific DNA-methyltransferase